MNSEDTFLLLFFGGLAALAVALLLAGLFEQRCKDDDRTRWDPAAAKAAAEKAQIEACTAAWEDDFRREATG